MGWIDLINGYQGNAPTAVSWKTWKAPGLETIPTIHHFNIAVRKQLTARFHLPPGTHQNVPWLADVDGDHLQVLRKSWMDHCIPGDEKGNTRGPEIYSCALPRSLSASMSSNVLSELHGQPEEIYIYIYINKECCRSVIRYTHQNRTSRLQPWKLTKIAFSSRIFLDQEWKCWQPWRRGAYRNQRSKWSCCECSEFSWSLRSMLSS